MIILLAIPVAVFLAYKLLKWFPMTSTLFRIVYTLYTKTPLGYLFHLHQLNQYKSSHDQPHSNVTAWTCNGIKIIPIAICYDNYSYLIISLGNKQAVLVDPSDPDTIKEVVARENVKLEAILTTHKHWDHSGGNRALQAHFPGIAIYGSPIDNIPSLTHPVEDNDVIRTGSIKFTAIFTPGHTLGHTVYLLDGAPFDVPDSLFSGDLLFLSGCGQIFEGQPSEMLHSLQMISVLKDNTLLWPGHEYAAKNLMFALTIEPNNPFIRSKLDSVLALRTNKCNTCPSTIGEEKSYNPFLRTHITDVISAVGLDVLPPEQNENLHASVLKALRERKNNFK
ncbi:probable hydrolase PNKD [Actinia tenebrosa]|uniref:Probable hydrolase PNKD n=1 Tax=Actinia tenebrosa TaxID=6105 RepID=A0A6P8J1W2_ACTTE|nr:probable hydrolase PNKD [Actinia tenebrosa]